MDAWERIYSGLVKRLEKAGYRNPEKVASELVEKAKRARVEPSSIDIELITPENVERDWETYVLRMGEGYVPEVEHDAYDYCSGKMQEWDYIIDQLKSSELLDSPKIRNTLNRIIRMREEALQSCLQEYMRSKRRRGV
jgi:hypothetical protein